MDGPSKRAVQIVSLWATSSHLSGQAPPLMAEDEGRGGGWAYSSLIPEEERQSEERSRATPPGRSGC